MNIVECLVNNGCDIMLNNRNGCTAWNIAMDKKKEEVAPQVLKKLLSDKPKPRRLSTFV